MGAHSKHITWHVTCCVLESKSICDNINNNSNNNNTNSNNNNTGNHNNNKNNDRMVGVSLIRSRQHIGSSRAHNMANGAAIAC